MTQQTRAKASKQGRRVTPSKREVTAVEPATPLETSVVSLKSHKEGDIESTSSPTGQCVLSGGWYGICISPDG